jgi:hypothetical protein
MELQGAGLQPGAGAPGGGAATDGGFKGRQDMARLFSRMMVMACETRLRMVAYWKPPTSERRGRRDFAEDAESKKIHRFSLRPLRILGVLCVWLFIFLMRRVAVRH